MKQNIIAALLLSTLLCLFVHISERLEQSDKLYRSRLNNAPNSLEVVE